MDSGKGVQHGNLHVPAENVPVEYKAIYLYNDAEA